jgi:hypothetical protein
MEQHHILIKTIQEPDLRLSKCLYRSKVIGSIAILIVKYPLAELTEVLFLTKEEIITKLEQSLW